MGKGGDVQQMIDAFRNAVEHTGTIVAGVKREQLDGPTPCTGYDVRALLNHMIGGNFMFATIVGGGEVARGSGSPDFTAADHVTAFEDSKKAVLTALDDPEAFKRVWRFPFGELQPVPAGLGLMLTETTVHGWDLAKATGQDDTIDPVRAAMILEGAKQMLPEEARSADGNPFGPAVAVPDDAPVHHKLVAFLGRTP